MTDHRQEHELASAVAARLAGAGFGGAAVAVQTGSGWPLPELERQRTVAWEELDEVPRATAPGHRGAFHFGWLSGVPCLVLEGRLHLYEGRSPAEVVRPVRAVGLLGVRRLLLTNAAGGVRQSLRTGDVVRVVDHLNLTGVDPLAGTHDPRLGARFVVQAGHAHDLGLAALAEEAALEVGTELETGVYAALRGPSFETAAEVRMLRTLGADVCGMSTVLELLAATQLGMATLVLSLVTNPAGVVQAGVSAEEEVLQAGASRAGRLGNLVAAIVARCAAPGDRPARAGDPSGA
jgi:purine-nucleoside phosphorylase